MRKGNLKKQKSIVGITMGDPAGIGPEIVVKAFDAYVAMYHDQSHIPIKTVAFDSIAGLIIGTPLVIATVGHGTAFEIAGKGQANARPMVEAIKLVSQSCGSAP
jgi:4-phospho-D-threonate 3-dehydrogenase / 4-phospho-D-erythronate 3-dehydrogenase